MSEETMNGMKTKHPAAPTDRRSPPALSVSSPTVTDTVIKTAIHSFGSGSAGGRDGLRPQHLKEMIEGRGGSLCHTLADFSNLVLTGDIPRLVRPAFFGATLLPFTKKGGGLRPIAVGLTLRRLVAKAAAAVATPACSRLLAPFQLGVGARGGAEALVHATRRYLDGKSEERAFVKLDFTNAFNTIRRDRVLEAVATSCPDLLPFVSSAYGSPSTLWLGDKVLSSEEGVQQGDPLGPLLFCLSIQPLLLNSGCEFVTGYLDDLGFGDTVQRLAERIPALETEARTFGLSLNHTKCEILGLSNLHLSEWRDANLNFTVVDPKDAVLLGSPLSSEGVEGALQAQVSLLKAVEPRLRRLAAHEGFFLLKSCFAVPRLLFLLRSAPVFASVAQAELSDFIRDLLSTILNIQIENDAWHQASLPVRWGGLGIRDVCSLAPSAFLGSSISTTPLVQAILPPILFSHLDPRHVEAISAWQRSGGTSQPQGEDSGRQRSWDDEVCRAKYEHLLLRADQLTRARLLAVASPDSGVWLHTLPCRNLGLCLSDRELRIAAGLRIGAPLVRPHACVCRKPVDCYGLHGLSCSRSAGRMRRHAQANDVIIRALRAADVQAELEPLNLFRDDGKRPDGVSLDPWYGGKLLAWDFTCHDTLAPSHVSQSASAAGSAASNAEQNKRAKYSEMENSGFLFVPLAIETLGTWGPSAVDFCRDLGSRLASHSGDPRSLLFLKQRLGLAVQRGNAASVSGTYPFGDLTQ